MSDYWTDNNIEKPQQIIVCAACRYKDIIICGARHWDKVMRSTLDKLDISLAFSGWEQGFIDQFGDFLTREEAMQVVYKNRQPFNAERNGNGTMLYSEGLY